MSVNTVTHEEMIRISMEPRPAGRSTQGRSRFERLADPALPVSSVKAAWNTQLWVVGAHGGAGESRLAELDSRWLACDHGWPARADGVVHPTVVVARSDEHGLMAAQRAALQYEQVPPPDVELLGLVVMADAPGRLPRGLRDLVRITAGGYSHCWQVPWIEQWRTHDPAPDRVLASIKNQLWSVVSTHQ